MIMLLPRLSGPSADLLLDSILGEGGFRWSGFVPEQLPETVRYAATGGTSIAPSRLRELREGLLEIANQHGFGNERVAESQGHFQVEGAVASARSTRNDAAGFDAALGEWMLQTSEMSTGEALRDDVWAFIGVVMAPDIVNWRFGHSRERYLGGVRNTFQRVWLRSKVLDRGPEHADRWGLLEQLSEDALVQITERPSVGSDPALARALAEGWVRAARRFGRGKMEDIMRLATLRLRIRNEVRALSSLCADDLDSVVDEFFDAAEGAISRARAQEKTGSDSVSVESDSVPASDDRSTRKSIWANWRAR